MKNLKYTLLIGIVIAFFAISVIKPNSGLDLKTLFKMVEQTNQKTENYVQKNSFSVTKSKIDPFLDKEPEKKTFPEYYLGNVLRQKEKELSKEEENEIKKRIKASQLQHYTNKQRYEVFYSGTSFNKLYVSDYISRNKEAFQSFYVRENGNIKSSLDNKIIESDDKDFVQPLEPLKESHEFIEVFDYKKITEALNTISEFVDFTEIDKFYVFKKEYETINNPEVKKIAKLLEIDKDLNRYGEFSLEDVFSGSWDKSYALINYNLDSTDMGIKKLIFTIVVEKDGVRETIYSFKEFEQFNIINDISLPKQLKESR